MDIKIDIIKKWLGTGAINLFGLPMSGKDTQGVRLAELLGAKFLSSGMIIRAMEAENGKKYSHNGDLVPTDVFYEWVLPYILREDLANFPLVYSSIGRWNGEENRVMQVSEQAGHEIKAAIVLNISEADVTERFDAAKVLGDRDERQDDKNAVIFKKRIEEFKTKTLPVLLHYRAMGLLIDVNGDQERDAVFNEIVEKLYQKAVLALRETAE